MLKWCVNKIPVLCFTSVHYYFQHSLTFVPFVSQINSVYILPSYLFEILVYSILILPSHLYIGFSSRRFLSGFSIKRLYAFFLFPIGATCPTRLLFLDIISLKILSDYCIHQAHYVVSCRVPLDSLGSKYLGQQPLLENVKPIFFP